MPHPNDPAPISHLASVAAPHPLIIEHTLKRVTLMSRRIMRAADAGIASAKLFTMAAHPQTWQVLFHLQQAILEQMQQQQKDWLSGWEDWLEEFAQIKRVNTMSKLVEQEFNLLAQFVLFLQERATSFVKLQENVEINYGYWINEEVGPPSGFVAPA